MIEEVRVVDGEILGIRDRISSKGDQLVELRVKRGAGYERCVAYAQRAADLKRLLAKLASLARAKGLGRVADLRVRVEVFGIVKSRDLIVTGFRLVH
jgi:hypothetical protein